MNRLKTIILLATLTALLMWAGQALGGHAGMWLALVVAAAMNIGAYWFSDRIVLRMYHAREVSPVQAPELYAMVHDLAARADLPMPKVYIIPEKAPNAFATGRNPQNGIVAVTEGLLRILDRREVAAVIAHELGHIKHRDTLIMAIAATFAGALSMLANAAMFGSLLGGSQSSEDEGGGSPLAGLLGVLIAPIAATLVQMSISRAREFMADEAAARYTGAPRVLASALRKIEAWSHKVPMHAGSPATAHLFILNPFSMRGVGSLFSTHPPTEERVARLLEMDSDRFVAAA
ncbi:MAG TPA: zinc metalloprotease HtpX [Terriglobales bacterium]|nr:zinc metalloprotease HtpX [Terriglobales bacterium]